MTVDTPVRYRMVGAVVLIFVAVLLLPWLFDGAGYEAMRDVEHPIPERPVFTEPRLPSVAPIPPAPVPGDDPPAVAVPEVTPVPTPEPVPRRSDGNGTHAAPPTVREPARATTPPTSAQRDRAGWVVQVGSFGRETNAREQTQRLREAGFPAFIERASPDGRDVWRVKVGPLPQRDEALRVRDDIRSRLNVAGIVIAHP